MTNHIYESPHEHIWSMGGDWVTLCHNGRRTVQQCRECLAVQITFRTHDAGNQVIIVDPPYVKS